MLIHVRVKEGAKSARGKNSIFQKFVQNIVAGFIRIPAFAGTCKTNTEQPLASIRLTSPTAYCHISKFFRCSGQ